MLYRITPLNLAAFILVVLGIYDYATNVNGDGLGGTVFLMSLVYVLIILVIDLLLQKFIKTLKWLLVIELVLVFLLVYWVWGGF